MSIHQPTNGITQKHFDWWDNLPELWKKIFCVALYYPEKMAIKCCEGDFYYLDEAQGYDVAWDFILNYSNPHLTQTDDLQALFNIKNIVFLGGFHHNPEPETIVTIIPPLHYFTKLEIFCLTNQQLDDISGLAGVTSLTHLYLHESMNTNDLSSLSTLTNLTVLDLSFNWVSDISVLSSLTKIKYLDLACNYIWDISALSSLVDLIELNLGDNPIQDIAPILYLNKLKALEIGSESSFPEGKTFNFEQLPLLKQRLSNTKIHVW